MYINYESWYINFKYKEYPNTENPPLGFMTYKEDNEAFEKRKSTVDSWATAYGSEANEGITLDNIPRTGFKIDGVSSRCSTDNKVFNVIDPRGFILQIYADNLFYLIEKCTIINGVISEPLIWTRNKQNNFLALESDVSVKPIKEYAKSLTVGDKIIRTDGSEQLYLGKKYIHEIKYNYTDRWNAHYTSQFPLKMLKTEYVGKKHLFYDEQWGYSYTSGIPKCVIVSSNNILNVPYKYFEKYANTIVFVADSKDKFEFNLSENDLKDFLYSIYNSNFSWTFFSRDKSGEQIYDLVSVFYMGSTVSLTREEYLKRKENEND